MICRAALNVNKNITSPPFRNPDNPSLTSPACPVRNSGKHSKRYPIVTSDPCSIGAYLARCRVQSCPIYRRTGNYSTTFCRRGKATMLSPNQVTLKFLSVRKKNRYQDNPHAGPRDETYPRNSFNVLEARPPSFRKPYSVHRLSLDALRHFRILKTKIYTP